MQPIKPMDLRAMCIAAGADDLASPVDVIVDHFKALRHVGDERSETEEKLYFELCFRIMLSDYHGLRSEASQDYSLMMARHGLDYFREPEPEIEDPEMLVTAEE